MTTAARTSSVAKMMHLLSRRRRRVERQMERVSEYQR